MHTNLGPECAASSVLTEVLVFVLKTTGRTNDCIVVCQHVVVRLATINQSIVMSEFYVNFSTQAVADLGF